MADARLIATLRLTTNALVDEYARAMSALNDDDAVFEIISNIVRNDEMVQNVLPELIAFAVRRHFYNKPRHARTLN